MSHENLGDGMYRNTVSDPSGRLRSLQEGQLNQDGSLAHSQTTNFDAQGNKTSESSLSSVPDGGYMAKEAQFDAQGNQIGQSSAMLDAKGQPFGANESAVQNASFTSTEHPGESMAPTGTGIPGAPAPGTTANEFQTQAEALGKAAASNPTHNLSPLESYTGMNETQAQSFASAAASGNYAGEMSALGQAAAGGNAQAMQSLEKFSGMDATQAGSFASAAASGNYAGEMTALGQAAAGGNTQSMQSLENFSGMSATQAGSFASAAASGNYAGEMTALGQAAAGGNTQAMQSLESFSGMNSTQAGEFASAAASGNYAGELQALGSSQQSLQALENFSGMSPEQARIRNCRRLQQLRWRNAGTRLQPAEHASPGEFLGHECHASAAI